jgi:aminoglycoside phosphotransferase (APT) family kinase protein
MIEVTEAVDIPAVQQWLTALGIEFVTPLRFQRIGLGQSNLTYRVTDDSGRARVLRRPPLGHLLASAHDVVREARIISALADTEVPAPRILGVTTESDVPLVLMEFVDGLVVDTMEIAEELTPQHRRQIALSMLDTLAKIHAVDLERTGLVDLASHKPYAQRQLKRWAGQWEQSKTREVPALDRLTRRLAAAAPEQREISLVHGDFEGFPDRAEMAELYLAETGRDPAALQYWHVLGMWKLAIIAEGVMRRALDEPQNKATAGTPTIARIDAVIDKACELADAARLDEA